MAFSGNEDAKKVKRLVALYNMVPNLVWSALHLVPVSVFCYTLMRLPLFYTLSAVSLLALFLPRSFFNFIQLSKTASLYEKIGVSFINKFTQNGELINGLIRKRFPKYKVVSARQKSINGLLLQTYAFEKFHFSMFLFFSFATVYALIQNHVAWALLLAASNVGYNIYPSLLQQYIRVRLMPFKYKDKGKYDKGQKT